MAQTPAERRARRDEYARGITDPRTGTPFKNYNALDTYQRNVKAQQKGFTTRAQERYVATGKLAKAVTEKFPGSWQRFLGGNAPTEKLARDFLIAFGPYRKGMTHAERDRSEALRDAYVEHMEDNDYDWNWDLWREEYSAL